MRPNWFIGFPINAGNWYETVITKVPAGIKSFEPVDLHITLAFLGPCGPEKALLSWEKAVELPLSKSSISLGRMAPFGNPERPSAYAFTIDHGKEKLVKWMKFHRDGLLELAGKKSEKYRTPIPHITIARPPRNASDELRSKGLEWALNFPQIEVSTELRGIALYTWSDDRTRQQFKMVKSLSWD